MVVIPSECEFAVADSSVVVVRRNRNCGRMLPTAQEVMRKQMTCLRKVGLLLCAWCVLRIFLSVYLFLFLLNYRASYKNEKIVNITIWGKKVQLFFFLPNYHEFYTIILIAKLSSGIHSTLLFY